jgi:hypothetical protein
VRSLTALVVGIAVLTGPLVLAAPAKPQSITCPYMDEQLTFEVPAKFGGLPQIDFDYPAKAKLFSFRDGHLLLIAMDEEERSRVRIVISAQLNKSKGTYDGQMVFDLGGHQLQIQSGPVSCTVSQTQ